MKNLVIGSGSGYSWYIWEPFIRSFVKNISNADLVLFVNELSNFTLHQLEQVGKEIKGGELKLIPFPKDLHGYPVNIRWRMFADYVNLHGSEYEQIFISDTRDVIFQGNIFECFADKKNFLGYAQDAGDIGGKIYSGIYDWVRDCFGKIEADKISDKICLCPSTIIGTPNEIKILLEKLLKYLPNGKDFHGADQATFVYIVYNGFVPVENEIFIDCQHGEILSTEWFHGFNSVKTSDKNILRGDGGVPAVVHQYDKHLVTLKFADEVHRVKSFKFDDRFTDLKSLTDQLPHLMEAENMKDALKIFAIDLWNEIDFKKYGGELITFWQILLNKKISDLITELLETALQRAIIIAFDSGIYVNQAKRIYTCVDYCKKHGRILAAGFFDWFKNRILQMTKFHVEHENVYRYFDCLYFMSKANLTDNKYFYLLQAETCLAYNKKSSALENYRAAVQYENESDDEEIFLAKYKTRMRENLPEEIRR